jgi:hypothetical protein
MKNCNVGGLIITSESDKALDKLAAEFVAGLNKSVIEDEEKEKQ